ncbi:hypothetical protein ANO14919_103850 [Xylariales sp. No.14919]|nr:hypothetical protein ANO14919_103850 [Xylariales sp. No.14919]
MFSEISKFDTYSLLGMLVIDSSGALHFYHEDLKQDLVLKAGKHSNAVLIVNCHQSEELILILLGVEYQLGTRKHWFNVSCVTLEELRHDPALMLDTIRDMERATPDLRTTDALVHGSMFRIRISLQAFMVKGICLYAVKLRGPHTVQRDSWLHLPIRNFLVLLIMEYSRIHLLGVLWLCPFIYVYCILSVWCL